MKLKFDGIEIQSSSFISRIISPLDLDEQLIDAVVDRKDYKKFLDKRIRELAHDSFPSNYNPDAEEIAKAVIDKAADVRDDVLLTLQVIKEWLVSIKATVSLTITGPCD